MRRFAVVAAGLALSGGLGLLAWGTPAAADRQITITGFGLYPETAPEERGALRFAWPEVEQLNALITLDLGGFTGEEKISLFLVFFDEDDQVVSKHRGKHYLPVGEHEVVFPAVIGTDEVFGEWQFRAEVEAALDGVAPARDQLEFTILGPDPPEVDILELAIYTAERGPGDRHFTPGDEFVLEAVIEIEDNEAAVDPLLVVYGMMEEDAYLLDPAYEYQPYQTQWDSLPATVREGVFKLTVHGYLPYFFAQPWDFAHPFRLYVFVDFGPGARTSDYLRDELVDYESGDHRQSDELADRLIELNRSYTWEVKRLRGGRPETRRFWD